MKYKSSEHGAISIFLVLILVPCLMVTSIFVDVGRVELGKSVANSSAELALNSLLANYDVDLNEWYGIMASCQNTAQACKESVKLFDRVMKSKGLEDDEIEKLSDKIYQIFTDEELSDYLKIETSDTKVEAVTNMNLKNAEIVKSDIVDFMKYRGPEVIIENIVNRIKTAKGISKLTNDGEIESDQHIQEQHEAYAESESAFMEAAYNSYKHLYNNYTAKEMDDDKLKEYITSIAGLKDRYKLVHQTMVTYLLNVDDISLKNRVTVSSGAMDKYTKSSKGCYSKKNGSTYTLENELYSELLKSLGDAITAYEKEKDSYVQLFSNNTQLKYISTYNGARYLIQVSRFLQGYDGGTDYNKKLYDAALKMMNCKAKLEAALTCAAGSDLPEKYEETAQESINKAQDYYDNYLNPAGMKVNTNDSYYNNVSKIEKFENDYGKQLDPNTCKLEGSDTYITSEISSISNELTNKRSELVELSDALEIAINGNGKSGKDKIPSLVSLSELADDYHNSYTSWGDAIDSGVKDEMQESEKKAYEECKEKNLDEITKENVIKMETRLTNAKSRIDSVIQMIDDFTYGGIQITQLTSYDSVYNVAKKSGNFSDIPVLQSKLDTLINNSFSSMFTPQDVSKYKKTVSKEYSVYIDPENTDDKALYIYQAMHKLFKDAKEGDIEKKKKEKDAAKKKNKDKESEKKNLSKSDPRDMILGNYDQKAYELLTDCLDGFIDIVKRIVNQDFEDIIDQFYVAVYALEMFSYDTYENEGKYNLLAKLAPEDLKSLNASDDKKYAKVEGKSETDEGTWKSTSLKDKYNKSLTNHMINSSNNYAYGAELEYILYGKQDSSKNVKSAYTDIFEIKFVLNTISGFQNFYSLNPKNATSRIINEIANGIQLLSYGIVPAALIKVILVTLLSLLETFDDIERLQAGFPVEIYKINYKEWHMRIPDSSQVDLSSFDTAFDGLGGKNETNGELASGLTYRDYMTLFIISGFYSGESSEAMTKRLAEVVQANMAYLIAGDTKEDENASKKYKGVWSLDNAVAYFKLTSKVKVKPTIMALPIFGEYTKGDILTKDDWCTFPVSVIRGY